MSMKDSFQNNRRRTDVIPEHLEFTEAERDDIIRSLTDQAGALEMEIAAAHAVIKTMHQLLHLLQTPKA
jgi:hypothetical protein